MQAAYGNEIRLGARQYVIAAAGYDTSGYKIDRDIKVFELDRPEMIEDKARRIDEAGIDRKISAMSAATSARILSPLC